MHAPKATRKKKTTLIARSSVGIQLVTLQRHGTQERSATILVGDLVRVNG